MEENQSACFKVDYMYGDLCGFRNDKVIWIRSETTNRVYCFTQDKKAKGIIAVFHVKQSKEIQDAN